MAPAPSKLYSDDVSLLVVALDTNPFFWGGASSNPNTPSLSFSRFLNHLLPFLNSIILLHQLNQVVVIATGVNSCDYIYDSSSPPMTSAASESRNMPSVCSAVLQNLEDFSIRDRQIGKDELAAGNGSSLLSGSLSLALCYIQRVFRAGPLHPQPRILCLQGSPDGPEQYVAVMNAIFSAQRSMIPIDSCVVGIQHSAFLQQASYITGGVYLKPQHLEGLFQYLSMVFATDLQSRSFLQLPKPVGVDFRASCFCHKKTIDMGYICSVCLSIYCKHHKKCSTCGDPSKGLNPGCTGTFQNFVQDLGTHQLHIYLEQGPILFPLEANMKVGFFIVKVPMERSVFNQANPDLNSTPDRKRKAPES